MIVTIILLTFAGISKAIMDVFITQSTWEKTLFKRVAYNAKGLYWKRFWSYLDISYKNKYKDIKTLEPQFMGSTTMFVFVTDAWHFFQMLTYTSLFLGIVFYSPYVNPIIDFIILRSYFGIIFSTTYYLLKRKSK